MHAQSVGLWWRVEVAATSHPCVHLYNGNAQLHVAIMHLLGARHVAVRTGAVSHQAHSNTSTAHTDHVLDSTRPRVSMQRNAAIVSIKESGKQAARACRLRLKKSRQQAKTQQRDKSQSRMMRLQWTQCSQRLEHGVATTSICTLALAQANLPGWCSIVYSQQRPVTTLSIEASRAHKAQ